VVCQLRQVSLWLRRLAQRLKNAGMEEATAQRRDGGQDGFASQFMAESQAIAGSPQQASVDTLVGFVEDRAGDGQQEGGVDRRAHHGRDVEDRPRFGREAGGASKDRISDRGWHGFAFGRESLSQKERVAPGEPV